ncbi:hypothetical protein GCM10017653_34250 [Ancylobacter defluvii]|uniref:Uncharacterized protein n=1 Tax=Ancylobacter defluvii TaxID=1282440 RepID=A0A9W6K092_9HYPH|nr:hypothetical protein GCM10017653_34250 [Ancylobacter defluvii]
MLAIVEHEQHFVIAQCFDYAGKHIRPFAADAERCRYRRVHELGVADDGEIHETYAVPMPVQKAFCRGDGDSRLADSRRSDNRQESTLRKPVGKVRNDVIATNDFREARQFPDRGLGRSGIELRLIVSIDA